MKPNKTDEQADTLVEARSEVSKLCAQLKRTEEERDILKRPQGTFLKAQDHYVTTTQLRNVSSVQPLFGAMALRAAHCEGVVGLMLEDHANRPMTNFRGVAF